MNEYDPKRFADKYQHASEVAQEKLINSGVCGFELEWNMLDSKFRPLLTVGTGPSQRSFVDYLREEVITPYFMDFSQLEVYHWMIEWVTRPYYHLKGAVYESRIMEAILGNSLCHAGRQFGERLYYHHGNLLLNVETNHGSIPGSWNLAKRRYLQRCVDLYGPSLATAGIHTNLSLPEPLLAWDFMHLPTSQRTGGAYPPLHLDDYKNQVYIRATRIMRAFAAIFVATTASTPFRAQNRDGRQVVILTEMDSVRNLTFPNPPNLDVPDLYRSYEDYLQISYDLVRKKVRFGNNNWTPVRARSFAEPVERLIYVTSEQLGDLYAKGLYAVGETNSMEEMAEQIEIQNLLARINIPMARVEIRTDEGGHHLELDIANLVLKYLLLLRIYADRNFASSFRYDMDDITRARHNEEQAAKYGLRGEIENPLTGKPVKMREFLGWTISEVQPLAEALGWKQDLLPLEEIAAGAPNTAEIMRAKVKKELQNQDEIPLDYLLTIAEEREKAVLNDINLITKTLSQLKEETYKISDSIRHAQAEYSQDPNMPIVFQPDAGKHIEFAYPDKISEILYLSQQLIHIPSVTACPNERLFEVRKAANFIYEYLISYGLEVNYFNKSKYPALLIGFPGQFYTPVMFSGHFDVVEPDPDDSQFESRIEGDYLWGRGAADMKTVLATYLVWLKDNVKLGVPYYPINFLFVGNEENGEVDDMGTPQVLKYLFEKDKYVPGIIIAGERTGERGNEMWGEICVENRGIMRFDILAFCKRIHPGTLRRKDTIIQNVTEKLLESRHDIQNILNESLTLSSKDDWHSSVQNPFIQIGRTGIYNMTPDQGVIGFEIRPIPGDDVGALFERIMNYCERNNLELRVNVMNNGIRCEPNNLYLLELIKAVKNLSKQEPVLGRKLPGTSARFAPRGNGIVWGQSGIAPHAREERHYIPSILPYYQALQEYATNLREIPQPPPQA